jgi:hypothetical protein
MTTKKANSSPDTVSFLYSGGLNEPKKVTLEIIDIANLSQSAEGMETLAEALDMIDDENQGTFKMITNFYNKIVKDFYSLDSKYKDINFYHSSVPKIDIAQKTKLALQGFFIGKLLE